MINGDSFAEYIRILAENDNTFEVISRALEPLWDDYHIARLTMRFSVENTAFTPDTTVVEESFSVREQIADEQVCFYKKYTTGEGGTLEVFLYKGYGFGQWSEQEKEDLNAVADVFFFHSGRFRLIKVVAKSIATDFMTGLPNTKGFLNSVKAVYQRNQLERYNGYYFNLKRFGLINKKYGKKEADGIICKYANMLREFAKEDEYVGRLGGDNFVALIKKERTEQFIDFLAGVDIEATLNGEKTTVTVSAIAGIYEIDNSIKYYEEVLGSTSIALSVAKNVTKQPFVYVTEELNERVNREKQIVAQFSQALQDKEFQVYYQPKVETDSYCMIGAEALVRWFHNGDLISPGEFVPVIERDGSVCKLDFYMLECVCADIARWKNMGIEPMRISVNFSRKHLSTPDLAEKIVDVLSKYGVERQYIEIEVTETVDEEEQGMLAVFTKKMQQYQIAVAIDDFGTGYSSLNVLRSFPVEVLKIDKSFIDNGNATENDTIVLSNIIHMAKQLNMDVVTEGVEKWEQVEFLHDMECNMVQGFLFDKPMPREDFEEKMQHRQYDVTKVKNYGE